MKDKYGYPYNKDRVEKELLNLQRIGYAIPVNKRGKQAWMYPTDKKLLTLERNVTVDSEIAEFILTFDRIPTESELITKLRGVVERQEISKRLLQISKLIDSMDKIIQKSCGVKSLHPQEKKKNFIERDSTCDEDKQDMVFYEKTINDLDGAIQDIDILTITKIIDARKNYFNKMK